MMNKYGTQDVCPKCEGTMHKVGVKGNGDGTETETRQCERCEYKAEIVVGVSTGATQTTPDDAST